MITVREAAYDKSRAILFPSFYLARLYDLNRIILLVLQLVNLLLEHGADITLTNVDGENALEIAIQFMKRCLCTSGRESKGVGSF